MNYGIKLWLKFMQVIAPHRLSPKYKLCLKRLKSQAQQHSYNRNGSAKRHPKKLHARQVLKGKQSCVTPSWNAHVATPYVSSFSSLISR
jgi:hypothetical protein